MTRDQLEHAIRAACDVANDDELWVFGSQALLGSRPDAPPELRRSMEADVCPRNRPEQVDRIDANLGEASRFHREHGFYVHGLPIDEAVALTPGWKKRTVPVHDEVGTRGNTGWCLEPHDLAASKLAAFRQKDREFVRLLLVHGFADADVLRRRIGRLDLDERDKDRLLRWTDLTADEIGPR